MRFTPHSSLGIGIPLIRLAVGPVLPHSEVRVKGRVGAFARIWGRGAKDARPLLKLPQFVGQDSVIGCGVMRVRSGQLDILHLGDPPMTVHLRRSAQARRLSLRVSRLDGKISLTIPRRLPLKEARAFAQSKEPWLRKQLSAQSPVTQVAFGREIPVAGVLRRIEPAKVRAAKLEGEVLKVPADPERVGLRVAAFLKAQARVQLLGASDHYARRVGRRFSKLTLRDTRSRWGSCTSDGGLMYSWRLMMAPPAVLSYVAAHEVAHLVEMNHSADFWAVVADLDPGYETSRRWLRTEGTALHGYLFE